MAMSDENVRSSEIVCVYETLKTISIFTFEPVSFSICVCVFFLSSHLNLLSNFNKVPRYKSTQIEPFSRQNVRCVRVCVLNCRCSLFDF